MTFFPKNGSKMFIPAEDKNWIKVSYLKVFQ